MRFQNDGKSAEERDEMVIVKVWEIYLLYHPSNLYRILNDLSSEGGHVAHPGRAVFKFSRKIWEDKVRDLLYEHRIPVVIQSNHLSAVSVKGRQPVLR